MPWRARRDLRQDDAKDPRFRYLDCNQVIEVLQKWLTNYRQNVIPAKASLGATSGNGGTAVMTRMGDSSNSFTKSSASSGRNLAGGSSGKIAPITNLSASDSGVLRKIAESSGSFVTSHIDLERDTNAPLTHRRTPATKDLEKEQQKSVARISQIAQANAKRNSSSSITPVAKDGHRPSSRPVIPQAPASEKGNKMSLATIAFIAVVMLLAAVALGFFIAKWVS